LAQLILASKNSPLRPRQKSRTSKTTLTAREIFSPSDPVAPNSTFGHHQLTPGRENPDCPSLIVSAGLPDSPIFSILTRISESSVARDRQTEKGRAQIAQSAHQAIGSRQSAPCGA
jgi:hypothetical protein